ncbi:MAG: hypothetical protein ACTSPB_13560 [Candidatus Thorarchaeota archaeon]
MSGMKEFSANIVGAEVERVSILDGHHFNLCNPFAKKVDLYFNNGMVLHMEAEFEVHTFHGIVPRINLYMGQWEKIQSDHVPNELTQKTLEESERGEGLEEVDLDTLVEELTSEEEKESFEKVAQMAGEIVAAMPKWKRDKLTKFLDL